MVEIASALRNSDHITNVVEALTQELQDLPTDALLMNIVDDAPASALYYMASQFGVLGWAGWNLARSEDQRRTLVKNAIRLQRVKGTPYSIKKAISDLGFGDVEIRTAVGIYYDGTYIHDGSIPYAGGNWASFRVTVNVSEGVVISPDTADLITAIINEYKPARSILVDVTWGVRLEDSLGMSEVIDFGDPSLVDDLSAQPRYDGTRMHDGTISYQAPSDTLDIRILPA